MIKLLLIASIVFFVACVLCLLYALLNLYGYHHVLDGTKEHYNRLFRKAIVSFLIGFVLAAFGIVCMFFYLKT